MNPRTIMISMTLQMTSKRDCTARHSSQLRPAPGWELALVEAEEAEVEATDLPVGVLLLAKDRAVDQAALDAQGDPAKVGV